jgi:hypothetical protein
MTDEWIRIPQTQPVRLVLELLKRLQGWDPEAQVSKEVLRQLAREVARSEPEDARLASRLQTLADAATALRAELLGSASVVRPRRPAKKLRRPKAAG